MDPSNGSCHACGATGGPLMKFSLGKDFFGPSIRPSLSFPPIKVPNVGCEACSMHKNLQTGFPRYSRRVHKLSAGRGSELAKGDELRRASVRLPRKSMIILDAAQGQSPLLVGDDVRLLMGRLNTATMPALARLHHATVSASYFRLHQSTAQGRSARLLRRTGDRKNSTPISRAKRNV